MNEEANYSLIQKDVSKCMGITTFSEAAALRIALKLLSLGRRKAAMQVLQTYKKRPPETVHDGLLEI